MRFLRAGAAAFLLLLTMAVVVSGSGAGAQSVGPTITPNNNVVDTGQRVTVTFDGFEARSATLSVCGNRAARGSGDCNMVESQGVRLRHMDVTMVHEMTVTVPPFPCPCVIRALGVETGEVAIVPIDLVGHPIADVSAPDLGQPLVNVGLEVAGATEGVVSSLKESLGGETAMVATVTVTNLTTEPVTEVAVHGRASRRGVTAAEFDLVPGPIGPGQTWTGTAEVTLPAPAMGEYEWDTTASGAGPVMTADVVTRQLPWLFVLFLLAFAGVISAVLVRAVQRRADERRALSVASRIELDNVIDISAQDEPRPPGDRRSPAPPVPPMAEPVPTPAAMATSPP